MSDYRSLSVTYFDPETVPVPEQESESVPVVEPIKRRGRPPGTKNSPKPKPKRKIPWFNIWRAVFWGAASVWSAVALYFGMQSWLGQSAAYLSAAVSTPTLAFLLDRDWKKMRAR